MQIQIFQEKGKFQVHIVNKKCLPVVHHQKFQFLDVMHNKFLKPIREIVPCLLVSAIANIGHQSTSFKLPPHA